MVWLGLRDPDREGLDVLIFVGPPGICWRKRSGDGRGRGTGADAAAPAQVDVWVRLDVGKGEHFADVLDDDGKRLIARGVANDQADLGALLRNAADRASRRSPGSSASRPCPVRVQRYRVTQRPDRIAAMGC